MKFSIILSAACFLLFSCHNIERVDSTEIREEIKARQVKQISATQFTSIADLWGKDFSASIIKELETELAKPNANTKALCKLQGLPKTDSVVKIYSLGIKLLGREDLQNQAINAKSKEVLDAFAYNAEKKLASTTNVQKLGDLMLFSAQVPYKSSICQACVSNDPTGLKVLSITIPKKTIARNITVKELKKIK